MAIITYITPEILKQFESCEDKDIDDIYQPVRKHLPNLYVVPIPLVRYRIFRRAQRETRYSILIKLNDFEAQVFNFPQECGSHCNGVHTVVAKSYIETYLLAMHNGYNERMRFEREQFEPPAKQK